MRVCVVGTGSWGTALAIHAGRLGHPTHLWGRRAEVVASLAGTRRHPALGDAAIPPGVVITVDAEMALKEADLLLWSVPVQATAAMLAQLERWIPSGVPLVSTSKGVELGTWRRPTEMIAGVLGRRHGVAVLSGPTFALEVAAGLPAAAVVASPDLELSARVQEALSSATLRLYRTADVIGVEIAGAAKNVIAIAAGLVDGLGLGMNTRAALLTRAVAEIQRFGVRLGGRPETFAGLAGMGDLVLTATGDLSRNRRVGRLLAEGRRVDEAISSLGGAVAEGVHTAPALAKMAGDLGVEMPIVAAVVAILNGELNPRDAVYRLMTRELKDETGTKRPE